MSTEAGATRRRAKEGFAVNGSSEDFLDGMKVQCSMAKSRDCNVLFQDCCCGCISSLSYMQDSKIFLGKTAFEALSKIADMQCMCNAFGTLFSRLFFFQHEIKLLKAVMQNWQRRTISIVFFSTSA